jgi:hypothetical protein
MENDLMENDLIRLPPVEMEIPPRARAIFERAIREGETLTFRMYVLQITANGVATLQFTGPPVLEHGKPRRRRD